MKKVIILFFLIIISNIFGTKLKVAVYEYPPIIINDNGEIKGILPEILNYIAKKEKTEIEYVYTTFADCFKKLENNDIDFVLGIGYTEERDKLFDYNKIPFINTYGGIYTTKYSSIYSFLDINNKKVGALKKDIYYEGPNGIKNIAKAMGLNVEFIEFDEYSDIFEAMMENKIDAGVFDYYIGKYFVEQKGIISTPMEFYSIELYAVYKNKDIENIINKIDENLRNLKSDNSSIYYQIINKYINEKHLPKWVYIILLIFLVTFFALLIIIFIMKKIINEKTKELLRKNIELEKLASLDPLTNVYNKRRGIELLKHLINLSKREKKNITLGFIDIDNLKYINDNYGHNMGDKIIQYVSKAIKNNVRKSDIVARFGGDEFLIALYNCDIKDAIRIEKNILKELKQISDEINIDISISFGFHKYNHNESIENNISIADKKMYQNKRKKKH